MSQGYQIYNQEAMYFLPFQIIDWVDVFTRKEHNNVTINCFDYCRKEKVLVLYACNYNGLNAVLTIDLL